LFDLDGCAPAAALQLSPVVLTPHIPPAADAFIRPISCHLHPTLSSHLHPTLLLSLPFGRPSLLHIVEVERPAAAPQPRHGVLAKVYESDLVEQAHASQLKINTLALDFKSDDVVHTHPSIQTLPLAPSLRTFVPSPSDAESFCIAGFENHHAARLGAPVIQTAIAATVGSHTTASNAALRPMLRPGTFSPPAFTAAPIHTPPLATNARNVHLSAPESMSGVRAAHIIIPPATTFSANAKAANRRIVKTPRFPASQDRSTASPIEPPFHSPSTPFSTTGVFPMHIRLLAIADSRPPPDRSLFFSITPAARA